MAEVVSVTKLIDGCAAGQRLGDSGAGATKGFWFVDLLPA